MGVFERDRDRYGTTFYTRCSRLEARTPNRRLQQPGVKWVHAMPSLRLTLSRSYHKAGGEWYGHGDDPCSMLSSRQQFGILFGFASSLVRVWCPVESSASRIIISSLEARSSFLHPYLHDRGSRTALNTVVLIVISNCLKRGCFITPSS